MATFGAELGCERYTASTVVTGSGPRTSTFLATLPRNSVFVLALRAFHCRPRRKKRATFTARVTSRMVHASRSWGGGCAVSSKLPIEDKAYQGWGCASRQNWPADDAVGQTPSWS